MWALGLKTERRELKPVPRQGHIVRKRRDRDWTTASASGPASSLKEKGEALHGQRVLTGPWAPSLDTPSSHFLGQLLGLCHECLQAPSAPTGGHVVQHGERPWMERLRKLGGEYHTEEKTQQDIQKARPSKAGRWPE